MFKSRLQHSTFYHNLYFIEYKFTEVSIWLILRLGRERKEEEEEEEGRGEGNGGYLCIYHVACAWLCVLP